MALLYLINSWSVAEWTEAMRRLAPDLDIRTWPEIGNQADITYSVAWLPPANVLRSLPNLKVIFSLGAGVDAILKDPTLPDDVPIARVNEPDLTMRMTEYVVLQVLMHHRQQRRMDESQRQRRWDSFATHSASAMSVGIMGLGVLGSDAARKLASLGFKVAGWSRSRKSIPGVECFAGPQEFDSFLERTDILVSLLPHTPETTGIINRDLIARLSRKGPFGAPILINAGRGKQQVESDILAALDSGALHAATLDVFETEPLPEASPFWSHPKVTVTPHMAADSDPDTISAYVLRQIRRHQAGEPVENIVDRSRGY
ncbi:glyoxylate/hydroxypyruvate reductase A [Nordella sp. HKS 07]|uniref:2-hydroxyacid dehydrogenase n=1 Tax=Nordella sp. HKS 07 TaxID=2712222 RepID=UPI0013E18CDC|nr:glyoxylate/hydroxypyruvate reductase A [Nordella sp. HKS 07]QIG48843.1 glyoxylate/hydroxypyruvate reductase A [Nordella sp. HKS 07]